MKRRPKIATHQRTKQAACIAAFLSVSAPAAKAYACSSSQTEVYRSAKTVWCVEKSIVTKFGAFPQSFFPYGDNIVDELVMLFHVPAEGVYTFEASVVSGGAHTGSECCGTGVTVTGDAFYNDGYGAIGFWGYLLSLHELINDFTGQVSNGWPTDFWADHVSAFPNSMDWHIMETLGAMDNDDNLKKASVAQKKRFYPGGDSEDARVGMFDKIFDLPNYGYPGFSRVFSFVEGDKLSWEDLGVPNPDPKRTEYVMAYLSLGAGKPVTSIMQAAHVGDGQASGAGDPGYVVSQDNIDAIATAHCSIAAAEAQGRNEAADKTALKSGNYTAVAAKGQCGTGCPAECGCQSSTSLCVAPWLGDQTGGAGGGGNGSGGSEGSGGGGVGGSSSGSGGAAAGGSSGDTGGGPGVGGSHTAGNGNQAGGADDAAGCSCRAVGHDAEGSRLLSLFGMSALLTLAFARVRARKP
jgi:hypothetical protein